MSDNNEATTFDQMEARIAYLAEENKRLRAELADARATLTAVTEQREYYVELVGEAREIMLAALEDDKDAHKAGDNPGYWSQAEQARAWLAKPDAWARVEKS